MWSPFCSASDVCQFCFIKKLLASWLHSKLLLFDSKTLFPSIFVTLNLPTQIYFLIIANEKVGLQYILPVYPCYLWSYSLDLNILCGNGSILCCLLKLLLNKYSSFCESCCNVNREHAHEMWEILPEELYFSQSTVRNWHFK